MTLEQHAIANEVDYWKWEKLPERHDGNIYQDGLWMEFNPEADENVRDIVVYLLTSGKLEMHEFDIDQDWQQLDLSQKEIKKLIKQHIKLAVFK